MSEEKITRKDLLASIGNIKTKDWLAVAEKLDLKITQPKSGTSHFCIRLRGYENSDIRGLVATVYEGMSNIVNKKIFKRFIDCGFKEDDVWKALGLLK